MPNCSRFLFLAIVLAIASGFAWQIQPASAQCASNPGDPPLSIKATRAANCLRYYAPYALQAAAAYLSVWDLDHKALRNFHESSNPAQQGGDPSLDGSDIDIAVQPYGPDVVDNARKYLRAWQYQFGNEAYLTCYDTSDATCMNAYNQSGVQPFSQGVAFQVWARTHVVQVDPTHVAHVDHDACSEVSIAFRGTVGGWADWETNGEPITAVGNSIKSLFTGRQYETDDYYHQLRRNIDAIIKRITELDCYRRAARHPRIVTVGHSLGGGLAQFAALARTKGPHIAKAFTFDSSPVIAAGLVNKQIVDENARELEIDRVYQMGEGLSAYVNPIVSRFQYAGVYSDCKPLIRYIAYDAVPGSGPVVLHALQGGSGLAAEIVRDSYNNGI